LVGNSLVAERFQNALYRLQIVRGNANLFAQVSHVG
jgi:hypothetical protein